MDGWMDPWMDVSTNRYRPDRMYCFELQTLECTKIKKNCLLGARQLWAHFLLSATQLSETNNFLFSSDRSASSVSRGNGGSQGTSVHVHTADVHSHPEHPHVKHTRGSIELCIISLLLPASLVGSLDIRLKGSNWVKLLNNIFFSKLYLAL